MVQFSTDDVHPRDRPSYWRDVIGKLLVRCELKALDSLEGSISAREINGIGAARYTISRSDVNRTASHARRDMNDDYHFTLVNEGQQAFEQEGRIAECAPGGLVLLDVGAPLKSSFQSFTDATCISIPRKTLEARLGTVSPYLTHFLPASDPIVRLVAAYISALPSTLPEIEGALAERVNEQILDMVGLAFSSQSSQGLTSARAAALSRLKAAITSGLSNPEFTPAEACLRAGVSLRYANSMLALEDTSVERLIYTLRLQQCKRALADKAQGHCTISEIAYAWGFQDQSHFTRRFREAFGMTPRDFRLQSLQPK